jgi:hypothetical protein
VPARVHVPIRIRTSADGLGVRRDELEDALSLALGRAVARSREVALARHGGPVTIEPPSFRWSGEAVAPRERGLIEARLRDVIAAACAELTAAPPHPPGSAARGPARERFDPARYDIAGRGYRIPSYDDDGDEVTVEVWGGIPATMALTPESLRAAIGQLTALWGAPDSGAHPGIVWLYDGALLVWFLDGAGERRYTLEAPVVWAKQGARWVQHRRELPPPGRAVLRVTQRFTAGDVDAYRAYVTAKDRGAIAAVSPPAAIAPEIERRTEIMRAHGIQTVMTLAVGGEHIDYLFPLGAEARFEGYASLLPVTQGVQFTPPRSLGGATAGSGTGGATRTAPGTGTGTGTGTHTGGGVGDADADGDGGTSSGGGTGEAAELHYVSPLFRFERDPADPLVCEPFLAEPSLDELGPDGARLRTAVDEIARRLEIASCRYAGQFCLMAIAAIHSHAVGLADAVAVFGGGATTVARADGHGNLGGLELRPTGANVLLQRLAGTVPLLETLARDMQDAYRAHDERIGGTYAGNWAGWTLHFLIEFGDAMADAVAMMFGETCRLLMLQLLDASKAHILARKEALPNLAHAFFVAILPELIALDELIGLQNRLHAEQEPSQGLEAEYGGDQTAERDPAVIYEAAAAVRIRDAHGREWTAAQLRERIAMRRGLTEELEPLVKHVRSVPAAVAAMRPSEAATSAELGRLIDTMLSANADVRRRVEWSWEDAFKYGQIDGDLPGETPADIGRSLHGIHLLAHQQIAPYFGSSRLYAVGVQRLFMGEHALEVVESLLVLGALVVVSVLCPPLGYVAGAALAIAQYADTAEKVEIRDALVNPEQVVDLAELDVEQFAAALGVVLALIPEAPAVVRTAYRAGAAALEEGALSAARRVAVSALRRSAVAGMRRVVEEGFVKLVATELVKVEVLNAILGRALQPVLRSVEASSRESGSVGGVQGALALIAWYRRRDGGGG